MTMFEGQLTSIAFCWTVERRDGAGVALTSSDRTIENGGTRFEPAPGVTPAAISRRAGLEASDGEVSGAVSSRALTDDDLSAGRWDGAAFLLEAADWAQGGDPVQLAGGELGTVGVKGSAFQADLRGAAAKLDAPVCPLTSPTCRASFGDDKCRVDLAGRVLRAAVIGADGDRLQLDRAVDERFLFGRLRYFSGQNTGLVTTVVASAGSEVRVRDLPPHSVLPGAAVELREGCDKRLATCRDRFGNTENFRGEPHLPGNDLLTRYPGE